MKTCKYKTGFTLVELLIVVAIIAILVSMVIAVASRIENKARQQLTESSLAILNAALGQFGGIDILINNAAILIPTNYEDVTEEEWNQVMDVNVKAPFFLSQKALPEMKQRGGGYIINISSTAALTVPPVAKRSSAMSTLSPGFMASMWISKASFPYSNLYSARCVL